MNTKYYQWMHDFSFPSPKDILIPDAWKEFDLFGGKKIDKTLPPFQLVFEKEKQLPDFIPNKEMFLFFNKRLVDFFLKNYSKKLIQTFEVEIKVKEGNAISESYFLINILNNQDVIDRQKSKLRMSNSGNILRIEHLEILEKDFEKDFFRLEDFSPLLISSEAFVNRLKEQDFDGMKFTPISKLFI
jgi:hypothetical protein